MKPTNPAPHSRLVRLCTIVAVFAVLFSGVVWWSWRDGETETAEQTVPSSQSTAGLRPNIILVLSGNQAMVADRLHQSGASINLGWWESIDEQDLAGSVSELIGAPDQRRNMSRAGAGIVDGRGADRVVESLERIVQRR